MLGLGFIVPFLAFSGFLLLLLVSLSVPIIDTISVLDVAPNPSIGATGLSTSGDISFGLWGYCVPNIQASLFGVSRALAGFCSHSRVGYSVDNTILQAVGLQDLNDLISRLTRVFILHPIACGLAFIALLFAITLAFRPARLASAVALIFSLLAAIVATVAFAVDVAIATVARNRVRDLTNDRLRVTYGEVPWMTLGAMVALWGATVAACCGIVIGGRRRRAAEKY